MKQHLKIHDSKRDFKCNECNKLFINQSRLNYHKQNVHGSPNFHCDQCFKMFRSKANFQRHQRIHTNEKPYSCPYCSFTCNNSTNLSSHVRAIHKDKDFTTGKDDKSKKKALLVKNVVENRTSNSIISLLATSTSNENISQELGQNYLKQMTESGKLESVAPTVPVEVSGPAAKSPKSFSFLKSAKRDQIITVTNSQGLLVKAVVKVKKETANGDKILHVCVKE